MAKSESQNKVDPIRPFYAAVGGIDVAVAAARTGLTDVQTRLSAVDIEPRVLASRGTTLVLSRVDALQREAKALPGWVEAKLNEYVGDLGGTVEELNGQYAGLADRGRTLVTRIRGQQATQELEAQTRSTVARAKTTKSQATRTADTTKRSAKATGTAARKTASAATTAAKDAAGKTGTTTS